MKDSRNHGVKILFWSFTIFFLMAFAAIKIEKAMGWHEPDLESSYWYDDGRLYYGKRAV